MVGFAALNPPYARSERRRPDDLPAVPVADFGEFLLAQRTDRAMQQLLKELTRPAGRIEEQHLARLGAGALPGMRDIARHEGAGTWPADGGLLADLERDFAAQDVGHFV